MPKQNKEKGGENPPLFWIDGTHLFKYIKGEKWLLKKARKINKK
tara:strand:+ start:3065 stop:3196 length:132 start_codon:yes stop_codon:yes gene_type:complete